MVWSNTKNSIKQKWTQVWGEQKDVLDEHNELSDGGNTTVIPTKNVIQKFLIKGL